MFIHGLVLFISFSNTMYIFTGKYGGHTRFEVPVVVSAFPLNYIIYFNFL